MRFIGFSAAALVAAALSVCIPAKDSRAAGGQIYDMSGMLSQPHPFARPGDLHSPATAPAPAGNAPLPGSQYRISTIPSAPPVLPATGYGPADPPQTARAGLDADRDKGWIYIPDPPKDSKPLFGIISEARLGVLDHASSILGNGREDGILISPEVLFTSPDFMRYIGSPMPTLGFQINTDERNFMYGGLTWRIGFLKYFHLNLGFGMGVHDGDLGDEERANDLKLGCRWLFHEVAALGVTLAERHVIEVQVDHYSHAHLCSRHNSGTESIGLVYGYRF